MSANIKSIELFAAKFSSLCEAEDAKELSLDAYAAKFSELCKADDIQEAE